MTGVCEYCGQVVEVGDQAVPDEIAWQYCGCGGARNRQRMVRQIERAQEHVEQLFGSGAGRFGLPQIERSTEGLLKDAIIEVASGYATSVTVVIPDGGVCMIRAGSKGEIKIRRRMNRTYNMETN